MGEMKTVHATEYVALLNERLRDADAPADAPLVTAQILGKGLQERTYLHIPKAALPAATAAVFQLRQQGIFCFPVLAPLDAHFLV
jgi:hypothetical protein